VIELVGAGAGVVAAAVAVIALYRRPTVRGTAEIDITNFVSVVLQAGRNPVTVLNVQAVVPARLGSKPGNDAIVLDVKQRRSESIPLDAKQSCKVGLELAMTDQLLPTEPGAALAPRRPGRQEVWVRVDYGRKANAKRFIKATSVSSAIENE